MRGCLAAAVLLVSAAAAPACRRTAAEMVAALDLRRLSHSPCASAVIHADERYVLKHVLTRRDSLLERETCVLQKLQRFDWAPRWFCTGDDYILTEWRGKEMCERTESYDAQVRRILDELHAAGVRHNDLRKRERTDFTVAAGRVSLVDFAYASVRGSLEMSCKGSFGLLKAGGNLTRSSSELEWGMAAPERGAAADLPPSRCGASKQVARVRGLCRPACIHEPYAGFEHLPRCEPTPYVPPTAGDWQCYAARNPDVAAALGRKVGALARHFYRHGFAEGRSPYCEADKGRYTCAFPRCDEARGARRFDGVRGRPGRHRRPRDTWTALATTPRGTRAADAGNPYGPTLRATAARTAGAPRRDAGWCEPGGGAACGGGACWFDAGCLAAPKAVWQPLSTPPELVPGTRVRAELVVAKCTKNVDWLAEEVEALKQEGVDVDRVTIYAKCGGAKAAQATTRDGVVVETRLAPNVGRCDETYARHMRDRYDDLRDLVLFAKDTSVYRERRRAVGIASAARVAAARGVGCALPAFETDWHAASHLRNWTIPYYRKRWSGQSGPDFASPDYSTFGAWLAAVLGAGAATATAAQARHLAAVGAARVLPVCFGGTFAASRAAIRSVPRATWAFVAKTLDRGDSVQEGHFAERAWAALLGPDASRRFQDWLVCRADAVVLIHRQRKTYCSLSGMLVNRRGDVRACAAPRADADVPARQCRGYKVTET